MSLLPQSLRAVLLVCFLLSATAMSSPAPKQQKQQPMLRFHTSKTWPYAARVAIALEETGEPYEKILIDLQNKPPEFLDVYAKANPLPNARAKVPVLEVEEGSGGGGDAVVLTESLIVAEYVGEKYPAVGLVPETSEDRAKLRLFSELCGSSSFGYFGILKAKGTAGYDAAVAGLVEGLVKTNAFLEASGSSKGPFLFGDKFTLAECYAAPFVQRCCFVLPTFTDVDPLKVCDDNGLVRLKEWISATLDRPSVKSVKIPDDEMKTNVANMLKRWGSA